MPTTRRFRSAALAAALTLSLPWLSGLGGCAAPGAGGAPAAAAPASAASAPAVAVAPSPPPPAPPVAFADAVARAGERLIADARGQLGEGPRDVIIDPLIDASTGAQTGGTVQMGEQLVALLKARAPNWSVKPLTRQNLSNGPLLVIGTLTAINTRNVATETADAFRLCVVLIDLRTGKLIAKRVDRATVETVNAEPTPFFRDSPTWHRDRTIVAYIKSCQGSSPGDSIDPAYLLRLPAAALLNEAILAYGDGRHADAARLYKDALLIGEPDDLRALNGLYLTSWKLNRRKDAADAFSRIVAAGLEAKRLPVKLLFSPATTNLLPVADLQAQYGLWLREVAQHAAAGSACLKVVGHTSRTGSPSANEVLSQKRAAVIEQQLEKLNRKLATRVTAEGAGSRETLIGLGTDDLRDALDRRVEFRVVDCSS